MRYKSDDDEDVERIVYVRRLDWQRRGESLMRVISLLLVVIVGEGDLVVRCLGWTFDVVIGDGCLLVECFEMVDG